MASLVRFFVFSGLPLLAATAETEVHQHHAADYEPLPPPEGTAFTQMTQWDVMPPPPHENPALTDSKEILIDAKGHAKKNRNEHANAVARVIRRENEHMTQIAANSLSSNGELSHKADADASKIADKVVDKIGSSVNNSLSSLDNLRKQFMNSSGLTSLDQELRQLPGELQRGPSLRQLAGTSADQVRRWLHNHNSWRLVQCLVISLVLSFLAIYQHLRDNSGTVFYSQGASSQERDPDVLAQVFNRPPGKVLLRIIGHRGSSVGGLRRFMTTPSRKGHSDIAFDVSLDLTPFVQGIGEISQKDTEALTAFSKTRNPFEILAIAKRVEWEGWQEVSDNIHTRLRELGYAGHIDVMLHGEETVQVLQNQMWPKFLRCPLTQALFGLTVVGLPMLPYTWMRTKATTIESRFKIAMKPARYWDLIGVGISAEKGFHLK